MMNNKLPGIKCVWLPVYQFVSLTDLGSVKEEPDCPWADYTTIKFIVKVKRHHYIIYAIGHVIVCGVDCPLQVAAGQVDDLMTCIHIVSSISEKLPLISV